jgi:dipeptidyl aminopeptidase/acylaminoacyl peptidase
LSARPHAAGRRAAIAVAGTAILVAAAVPVARGATLACKFLRAFKHPIPLEVRAEAFRTLPGLSDVELHTADGLALRGWFWPGTRRAAVILVHGDGGDRTQVWPNALVLARHGYGVLVFDSRAHGESDGDRVTWGDAERLDVTAALDFTQTRPDVDPQRVALLGFSIGGTTTTLVAAADPRVRAAIVSPVWTSLEDEVRSKSGRLGLLVAIPAVLGLRLAGVDVGAVRPIDRVARIAPRPIFFIAGTSDTDTPLPVMQRMFDAAAEPKRLWIVPGAEHGGYLKTAPVEYEARVVAFLDQTLNAPPGSP